MQDKVKIEGPFSLVEKDGALCIAAEVGPGKEPHQKIFHCPVLLINKQNGEFAVTPQQAEDLVKTLNAGWEVRSGASLAAC